MNIKNNHFYQLRHSGPKKILASLVILAFFFSQTVPSGFADITLRPETRVTPYQPETDATDDSSNSQQTNQTSDIPLDPNAVFSQDELSLTPSDVISNDPQTSVQTARDAMEYSFDQAADYLTLDYAAAVIVRDVTAEDLRSLVQLDVEVGIAVIRGKAVFFTSGSSEELRANIAAQTLLQESPIIVHTHPAGERTQPSLSDFSLAGETVEYLLSEDGVYAYNRDGLISEQPLTEEELADLLRTAQSPEASSVEARAILNNFISEIDEYNSQQEQTPVFRSADPITVFSGQPTLGAFSSADPNATSLPIIGQTSTSEFSVNYNVTPANSYSGAVINFDPNRTGQSQDLSGYGSITFEMKTATACTGHCLKLELKDAEKHTAAFWISDLTTSYEQISIPRSAIAQYFPEFKLDQVKEITFVFENTQLANKTGRLDIKTGGLYFEPPVAAGATGLVTDMYTYKVGPGLMASPAGAASNLQTPNSTQLSFNYNIPSGSGNWGGAILTFGANGNPLPNLTNNNLTFEVSGTSKLRVSVSDDVVVGTNGDGSPRYRSVTLVFTGISATNKYITITQADLLRAIPDFHYNKVTSVAFVVDKSVATGTGTVTVKSKGLVVYPPAPATSTGTLTDLGIYQTSAGSLAIPKEALTSFSAPDSTQFSFGYNVPSGSVNYAAGILTFGANGNPNPDLTSEGLTFSVTVPSGVTTLKVSVSDDVWTGMSNPDGTPQYRTATLLFTGISATNKYITITQADLLRAIPDFHYNKLTSVAFVVDKSVATGTGTVTVKSQGLYFEPSVNALSTGTVTDLKAYQVGPGVIESPASAITGDLHNTSSTAFSFDYNIPAGSKDWGGGILVFNAVDGSGVPIRPDLTNSNLTFEVSGTGTLRVSVSDDVPTGMKNADGTLQYRSVTLVFIGINTTNKFVTITKETLQKALSSFHFNAITSVSFVVNKNVATGTGTVTVKSEGLYYVERLNADPTLSATSISHLSGLFQWVGFDSDKVGEVNVSSAFVQSSTTQGV
ncbi:MAG: hypothetical protein WC133_03040, partial [Candidatus Omnitrophota bacterium]